MTRPEWVEAGASSLRSHGIAMGEGDYSWEPTPEGLSAAVIAAIEPLIRADERGKARVHATGTSTGDGPCCECCYDVLLDGTDIHAWAKLAREANDAACRAMDRRDTLRAQIAADIEETCEHYKRTTGATDHDIACHVYRDAARIARGGTP